VQVLELRKSPYQRVVANFREDRVMSKHDGHSTTVNQNVIHFNYVFPSFVIYDDERKGTTLGSKAFHVDLILGTEIAKMGRRCWKNIKLPHKRTESYNLAEKFHHVDT
jgi:hypothetical protein